MKKAYFLRKKYPKFVYYRYSYKIKGEDLKISFSFSIAPDIFFNPNLVIKNIDKSRFFRFDKKVLDNLIFHLGLIEIPSYWKTTCSPEIEIRAGELNKAQIKWWRDLIIKGMGQFFYENKINWRTSGFLKIKSKNNKKNNLFEGKLKNRYLVPFGGGRDSIVTLENLKKRGKTTLFLVNPNKQIEKVVKVANVKKQIIVKRIIDRKLLELNKKGYLNGHTPFTAVLSFLSVFCAVLFDYKNIAFSNEKSSDEGNVKYLGKIINHQWAKSSEFEIMFKKYCKKYLTKDVNYFSFLRKYTELEISETLIKYPKYFPVFSSCNAGMRIGAKQIRWCGRCPKCLFVYLTFYPFLNKKQLLKIFGKDFFNPSMRSEQEKIKLLSIMKGLTGKKTVKPFECVGTKKESLTALSLCLKKAKKERNIPFLLNRF